MVSFFKTPVPLLLPHLSSPNAPFVSTDYLQVQHASATSALYFLTALTTMAPGSGDATSRGRRQIDSINQIISTTPIAPPLSERVLTGYTQQHHGPSSRTTRAPSGVPKGSSNTHSISSSTYHHRAKRLSPDHGSRQKLESIGYPKPRQRPVSVAPNQFLRQVSKKHKSNPEGSSSSDVSSRQGRHSTSFPQPSTSSRAPEQVKKFSVGHKISGSAHREPAKRPQGREPTPPKRAASEVAGPPLSSRLHRATGVTEMEDSDTDLGWNTPVVGAQERPTSSTSIPTLQTSSILKKGLASKFNFKKWSSNKKQPADNCDSPMQGISINTVTFDPPKPLPTSFVVAEIYFNGQIYDEQLTRYAARAHEHKPLRLNVQYDGGIPTHVTATPTPATVNGYMKINLDELAEIVISKDPLVAIFRGILTNNTLPNGHFYESVGVKFASNSDLEPLLKIFKMRCKLSMASPSDMATYVDKLGGSRDIMLAKKREAKSIRNAEEKRLEEEAKRAIEAENSKVPSARKEESKVRKSNKDFMSFLTAQAEPCPPSRSLQRALSPVPVSQLKSRSSTPTPAPKLDEAGQDDMEVDEESKMDSTIRPVGATGVTTISASGLGTLTASGRTTRASLAREAKSRNREINYGETYHYKTKDGKQMEITAKDVEQLNDGEYLNDTLISVFLQLEHDNLVEIADEEACKNRYKEDFALSIKDGSRTPARTFYSPLTFSNTQIFSTYFVHKLQQKPKRSPAEIYEDTKKWTSKIDIFSKQCLIIPIVEHTHWYVMILWNLGAAKAWRDREDKPLESTGVNKEVEALEADDETMPAATTPQIKRTRSGAVSLETTPEPNGGLAKSKKYPPLTDDECIWVFCLDSLNIPHKTTSRLVTDYITNEAYHRTGITIPPRIFKYRDLPMPVQGNSWDCGVFLIDFVQVFMSKYTQLLPHMAHLPANKPKAKSLFRRMWSKGNIDLKRRDLIKKLFQLKGIKIPEHYSKVVVGGLRNGMLNVSEAVSKADERAMFGAARNLTSKDEEEAADDDDDDVVITESPMPSPAPSSPAPKQQVEQPTEPPVESPAGLQLELPLELPLEKSVSPPAYVDSDPISLHRRNLKAVISEEKNSKKPSIF